MYTEFKIQVNCELQFVVDSDYCEVTCGDHYNFKTITKLNKSELEDLIKYLTIAKELMDA